MKLLLPKERVSLKQQDEERLAKEQTALSGKVDGLRELEQSERKKLQDFQEREFEKFKEEKLKREAELLRIDDEIAEKKKERALYFEENPIDKQWILYVKTEKANIEAYQLKNSLVSKELEKELQKSETKKAELEVKEKEIRKGKLEAAGLSEKAKEELRESGTVLSTAYEEAKRLTSEAERLRNSARIIQHQAQSKMNDMDVRMKVLDKKEADLEERETQVLIKELLYYSPVKK